MSYNLFLDDVRDPEDVAKYIMPTSLRTQFRLEFWHIVRSYEQFVAYILKKGIPDKIAFDHDLADEHYDPSMYLGDSYNKLYDSFQEKTGFHAAKWLCEYCMDNNRKLPEYVVHSQNPLGKENITMYLENFKKHR